MYSEHTPNCLVVAVVDRLPVSYRCGNDAGGAFGFLGGAAG